jgi:hypothetical protein
MSHSKRARSAAILTILATLLATLVVTVGAAEAASGDYGTIKGAAAQRTCSNTRCSTAANPPGPGRPSIP